MKTAAQVTGLPSPSDAASAGAPKERGVRDRAVSVAFLYLGLSVAIPQYTSIDVGPLSSVLFVACALAIVSFSQGLPKSPSLKRYLTWAIGLGIWAFVSSVSAWDVGSMSSSIILAIWVVVLVPGLAALMEDRRHLDSLLVGLMLGAAVYAFVAFERQARFGIAFDIGRPRGPWLLGLNRIVVNIVVLLVLPYLIVGHRGRLFRWFRWPLSALILMWVINSGGRAGLLALVVVLLVIALIHPNTSLRTQRLLAALAVVVAGYVAIQGLGGPSARSLDRLLGFAHGERDDSDNARELLLRKAWHLANENPVFGVGYGQFESTYHPVVEEAPNVQVRLIAAVWPSHNTFATLWAEIGYPGLFLFIGLFVTMLRSALKYIHDKTTRGAIASLAGFIVGAFFMAAGGGPRLFFPLAVLLSLTLAHERAGTLRSQKEL